MWKGLYFICESFKMAVRVLFLLIDPLALSPRAIRGIVSVCVPSCWHWRSADGRCRVR